jgi:DNA-binding transcriptional LysR family regulator
VIDKLEFLIALARERNFSRAAESCGVTQPTLSAGIKQLEDTLGVLLVNRSSRFYGLTAEGERVLDWARRIVSDARAMRQDVHASKTALAGHLTFAAVPTALPMVAELTTPFRTKHPDVRFTVLSSTSREILSKLDDFQIDAGLTYLDNEPLGQLHGAALSGEVQAFDLRRKPARRARGGDLGGCRAHSPRPAHPRHAKPPHYRPAPGEFRRAAAYRIQLDGGLIFACPERRLRVHRAGKARQSAGRDQAPSFDSHHGAPRTSHHRTRVAESGADSAINPGAYRRSRQARHAAKTATFERSPLMDV